MRSRRDRLQPEAVGIKETNSQRRTPGLRRDIIRQLTYPSFITNERSEVLAWNDKASEVLSDFGSLPDSVRIMLRLLFLDLELRRRMLNWEEFALYSVGVYRTYYDMNLHDPWYKEMVDQLLEDSADFAEMWKQHNILGKKVNRVVIESLGTSQSVVYDINSMANLADYPGLHICIYTPVLT